MEAYLSTENKSTLLRPRDGCAANGDGKPIVDAADGYSMLAHENTPVPATAARGAAP